MYLDPQENKNNKASYDLRAVVRSVISVTVMLCTRAMALQKPRPSLFSLPVLRCSSSLRIGPLLQLKKSPSLQKGHLLSVVLQAASRLLRQLAPLVVECTAVPENASCSTWVSALSMVTTPKS